MQAHERCHLLSCIRRTLGCRERSEAHSIIHGGDIVTLNHHDTSHHVEVGLNFDEPSVRAWISLVRAIHCFLSCIHHKSKGKHLACSMRVCFECCSTAVAHGTTLHVIMILCNRTVLLSRSIIE